MALTLYLHPLASFCHKVLMALFENGTPFAGKVVDLADREASEHFFRLWPVGKIPVLHDDTRDQTIPETTIIIEYLEQHYPAQRCCRMLRTSDSTLACGIGSSICMCRCQCRRSSRTDCARAVRTILAVWPMRGRRSPSHTT